MTGVRSLAVVACAALAGCMVHETWYVVHYDLSARSTDFGEARLPPDAALQLLAHAKVVAFAPPDECDDTGDAKLAGMRCGEVMSGLEEAAIEAGFEVVSWQALRGDQPALSYARHNNVDILFNVNRLSLDNQQGDVTSTVDLRFAQVAKDGTETAIAVKPAVQKRCSDLILPGATAGAADSTSVLLDVSMVGVSKGQTLWNYRRLFTRALFTEGSDSLYYAGYGKETTDDAVCDHHHVLDDPFAVKQPPPEKPVEEPGSDRATFQATITGDHDADLLRQVSRAAASEFVELLVFLQATQPPVKKHAPLKRPSKPKEMREKRDPNCDWLESKKSDLGPDEYARFLKKYPECA